MATSDDQRTLSSYLREIGEIPLLSAEEEVELARRAREGDEDALRELTRSNLRFVVSVAKRYRGLGLSLPDLINEGNYGLIKAARRFDETLGFRFISYAVWWIRQAILQALSEKSRTVRIPTNHVGLQSKIRKSTDRLRQELGRSPTIEEIAIDLEIDPERVLDAVQHTHDSMSLDAPFSQEEDGSLLDVLPSGEEDTPDHELIEESLRLDIEAALDQLDPREAEITRLYFGIGQESSMTLDQIAEQFDLSRERVRHIKEQALRTLRWGRF
jgi:RNA polymerase primary sigma factor